MASQTSLFQSFEDAKQHAELFAHCYCKGLSESPGFSNSETVSVLNQDSNPCWVVHPSYRSAIEDEDVRFWVVKSSTGNNWCIVRYIPEDYTRCYIAPDVWFEVN